jgi:hypothetical protein
MALCTQNRQHDVASLQTVRARKRQGSNSLDLTVPTKVARSYEIRQGDIFEIDAILDRGEVKLIYKRVYRKR